MEWHDRRRIAEWRGRGVSEHRHTSGLTTLTIGTEFAGSTSYLNGWVQRVRYWTRALSDR